MKVLLINTFCGVGSTGRICTDIAAKMEAEGHTVKVAYGRDIVPKAYARYAVRIGNDWDWKLHALKTRIFDKHGFGSSSATKKFLKWVDGFQPDMVWLHNIHGYYINIEMLFDWLKSHPQLLIKWTLHDCWAFTGHCTHFTVAKCNQWKTECKNCIQKDRYPKCIFFSDVSSNYKRKKKAFTGVNNLTIITPSEWLARLTKDSFLKDYPVEVNYNKIDANVFKPTPSNFRKIYGLENKFIVLGVANVWNERKGLYDFYKLSTLLNENYAIVLVGLNQKQINDLPKNIIGIKRTYSSQQLATIYTAADVFVNPSKEETFGMTTAEAVACGTKAIVYKNTACEEIANINGSLAVEQNVNEIYRTITNKLYKFGGVKCKVCSIICIPKTTSVVELASIYTASDILFNPTYEDNYPTVNLEAEACGTKVITYNVGGSEETLHNPLSKAISAGAINEFVKLIRKEKIQ